jgi:hypothetical protein
MNAEFNWWLLIVGLVAGAGLVWLVIADWSRREEDLSDEERQAESAWIAQVLQQRGESIDPGGAEQVLALHRAYLRQIGGFADDVLVAPGPSTAGDELTTDEEQAGPTDPDEPMAQERSWLLHAPDETAEPPPPRPTVRARPLGPRGGPVSMESEPPRPS